MSHVVISLVAVLVLGLVAGLGAAAGLQPVFGVAVPYAALGLFILGIAWRVLSWSRVPVPFRIPTTGGQQKSLDWIQSAYFDNPHNTAGVIGRMALEVLFFRSLFRNTRASLPGGAKVAYWPALGLWAAALAFHWSFLVIVARHLRFFTEPVPLLVLGLQRVDGFLEIGKPILYISTLVLLAALSYLLFRRLATPSLRYISLAGDYFPLFLLLAVGVSGLLLKHFIRTDITQIKALSMGLIGFSPVVPAGVHWLFYVHLFYVSVLLAWFPFSKLAHAPGVFLSPTRNLANNNRAVRHVNPWDYPVKVHTYEAYEDEFREKMVKAGIPVDKPLEEKADETPKDKPRE